MQRVQRKGTVWLLQMTKGLSDENRKELLAYVGSLEQSEDRAFQAIETLAHGIGWKPPEPKSPVPKRAKRGGP